MKKFHGIYPALITPITISGKIDYTGLRRLIRMNLKKNIQGFYVCGSTAEVFLLDDNQRKKILETVIDEVNGKCPIIVQVGSLNQKNACNLAIHAQQSGADVVSSVPPFYYQFSMDDILNYYRALADAVELPILIYNIPVFSGVKFTVNDLRPLLDDDRFIGLKHTSTDFYMLERLKAFWPHKVVFNGLDEVFLSGLCSGADGGIGSTYNFMAEKFIQIYHLIIECNITEARKIQNQVNNIIDMLSSIGFMSAIKETLSMMGICSSKCIEPFPAINEENKEKLLSVLVKNNCMDL